MCFPYYTRCHDTLPIFRICDESHIVFYAPGYAVAVSSEQAEAILRCLREGGYENTIQASTAARLVRQAEAAVASWNIRASGRYRPTALLVYAHHDCNSSCSYCFASRGGARTKPSSVVSLRAIEAAAKIIACNCVARNLPFVFSAHGGGEPTFHWDHLRSIVDRTRSVASRRGVSWRARIATNGVLEEDRMRWIATHFDHVGLSCDGPPDIHDVQRPLRSGAPSSPYVERTAAILHTCGTEFSVRVTVTPYSAHHLTRLVRYIVDSLRPNEIRILPVYWSADQVDETLFVRHFLEARKMSKRSGCPLSIAGMSMDELHGTYCSIAHDVLHVLPDDSATACFFSTGQGDAFERKTRIGEYRHDTDCFVIDEEAVREIGERYYHVPSRCRRCVNCYHCPRDCPDVCQIREPVALEKEGRSRCRILEKIALGLILEMGKAENHDILPGRHSRDDGRTC